MHLKDPPGGEEMLAVFGWFQEEGCFQVGGRQYDAFRSDYWIDYMLKSGGYDASDSFN